MTDIAQRTLGDLVTAMPSAARVFERAGLDYCCRGRRTLTDACAAAGLDAAAVEAELAAAEPTTASDWASLPLAALADHIVATHHAYLHEELPLLDALAEKVDRAHGARHPELARVRALVAELRGDLEPHLAKEERVLFPALHAMVEQRRAEFAFGTVANPIRMMTLEHDRAGAILAALGDTTGGYAIPADACASYRSLYERLDALERDTHIHIHKENNVLFPAAERECDALAGVPTEEVAPR
jgi:regulator of cell morphogenesis and NO signaling